MNPSPPASPRRSDLHFVASKFPAHNLLCSRTLIILFNQQDPKPFTHSTTSCMSWVKSKLSKSSWNDLGTTLFFGVVFRQAMACKDLGTTLFFGVVF